MNDRENNAIRKSDGFKRVLLYLSVFIIAYALVVTAVTPKQYSLEVGQIPMQDIKAPRDTVDENETEKKEEQAIEKVDKQYTQKTEVKKNAEDNIKSLFDKLTTLSNADSSVTETAKISQLKGVGGVALSDSQYAVLLAIPKTDIADVQKKVVGIIDKAYEKNICLLYTSPSPRD